ncbi:MAG: zinc ribbon domain-containing protein [Acidobacteriota bacterium]
MNCPDCGNKVTADQQFCRSCGASLWADEVKRFVPSPIIGILLAFGGIIVALTGKMLLQQDFLVFIGVVLSIIGMASIALIPLIAAKRAKERSRRVAPKPSAIPPAEPTMKLPPMAARDEFHSVIEDTTELLNENAVHNTRS